MTVNQCLHYALTRPGVFCVLPSCQTGSEVENVLKYLEADSEAKDYAPFLSETQNDFRGQLLAMSGWHRHRNGQQVF